MKKAISFFAFFVLLSTIVYSAGEFGAGNFGDSNFGFGTPAPEPTPTTSSGGGGGGSGGGGGAYTPPPKEVVIDGKTIQISLSQGKSYQITFKNNEVHNLTLDRLYSDKVDISAFSKIRKSTLYVGEWQEFLFDKVQFLVTLKRIVGGSATFEVRDLTYYLESGVITGEPQVIEIGLNIVEEPQITEIAEVKVTAEIEEVKKPNLLGGIIIVIIVIVFGLVAVFFYYKAGKEKKDGNTKKD